MSTEYTKNLNLLILEDDSHTMLILEKAFSNEFLNVFSSDSGQKGLDIINTENIHVIISDINIYDMDGIEVLEQVRQKDLNIPFILISSENDIDYFTKAINLGATSFVGKPLNIKILKESVQKATSLHVIEALKQQNQEQELELLKLREKHNRTHMENAFEKELNLLHNDLGQRFIRKESPDGSLSIQCYNIFYKPQEILSGDCYSTRIIDEQRSFSFIIDTMGKGLAASVTAIISASYINHLIDIHIENNTYDFHQILDQYLTYIRKMILDYEIIAASFFEINTQSETVSYSHFGMPYMLFQDNCCQLTEINSNNPPISKWMMDFAIDTLDISNIIRILSFSDGIVEIEAAAGESAMEVLNHSTETHFFFNRFHEYYSCKMGDFDDDTTVIQYKHYQITPDVVKEITVQPTFENINETNQLCEQTISQITDNDDVIIRTVTIFNELLMNAYEHGSLGLTFQEKHQLIEQDEYHDELLKREKECTKQIHITISKSSYCNHHFIMTTIRDEGDGFNLTDITRLLRNKTNFNGRGIIISKMQADELYYNIKGNEVIFFIETNGGT